MVRNEKSWHLHIILFLIIDHAWSWGMVPATLHIPELGPERPQKPGLNQLYCGGVSKCTMSKNLTRPAFNATRGHLPHCRTLATLTIPTDHSVTPAGRGGCPPSGAACPVIESAISRVISAVAPFFQSPHHKASRPPASMHLEVGWWNECTLPVGRYAR